MDDERCRWCAHIKTYHGPENGCGIINIDEVTEGYYLSHNQCTKIFGNWIWHPESELEAAGQMFFPFELLKETTYTLPWEK